MTTVRCQPASRTAVGEATPRVSPCLGARLLGETAWARVARSLGLSPRELQIVRNVFDDATEQAIAANLGCSPHTIHTHFERLHRKLGVQTRAQIILRVMQEFLALTTRRDCRLQALCDTCTCRSCPRRTRSARPVCLPSIG